MLDLLTPLNEITDVERGPLTWFPTVHCSCLITARKQFSRGIPRKAGYACLMSCNFACLFFHFRGGIHSSVVMLDSAFQPTNGQHGTVPTHHRNTLCRPACRHLFRSDVPYVHITFARAQCHNFGRIDTRALDDTQLPVTFLKFTKLTNIFAGSQVLIVHPVSSIEKQNVMRRAAEEGQ